MSTVAVCAGAVMSADRARERDADFSAWMSARQPALLRTAYLLTSDHHTAEDLVQATLAKVYLTWERVQRREAIDGYARRILVNENNSLWRRAWKKRETVSDEVPDWVHSHDTHDDGQHSALWQLVQTLPRKQRAAVVLRYYEELTEAETADVLGVSVGTVKSQTSRALDTLRRNAPDHGLQSNELGKEES